MGVCERKNEIIDHVCENCKDFENTCIYALHPTFFSQFFSTFFTKKGGKVKKGNKST